MLTFLLVGGFYVKQVPVWIGWIKYVSFVYWGYNLLLKIQFGGATYYSSGSSSGPGGQQPVNVQHSLGLPTDPNSSRAPEVLVLLAMLLILRSLTYMVLRHKTEVRQPKQPAAVGGSVVTATTAAGGAGAGGGVGVGVGGGGKAASGEGAQRARRQGEVSGGEKMAGPVAGGGSNGGGRG
ncbi:hypothetical protein HYH02_015190 [Chlamydomonas schloesseri]|uniref:ABC-2 type transporter domain-containing protein n=1 Tax=Chlamydomonas schloesseri TaxID=2026947 RepID=A0A835VQR9_9CHLO|nr:hypothetical protein HYH02_015190 [Chlamydomonas schloesseri]|eukprot:KAG2424300.1 hypothetical protein HYH02_015190 [Chlamydomonas schloesseri]